MLKIFTPIFILLLVSTSLLLLEERKMFDIRTLTHIDPTPHTQKLIGEKKYVEAEEYLSFFMKENYVKENPKANELLLLIQNKRASYPYKAEKFLEGIVKGGSDEDIGRVSAIASDFLVVGDIRDLSIEGVHYANDQKVDKLIVALSSLGLLATAGTVYSLGAAAPIKTSISLLKYGKRVKKIPSWFQTELIKYIKIANETKSLEKVNTLLQPIHKLYNKVGLNQTLHLLKLSKNANELKILSNFGSRFGKNSQVLLQTTNNKALAYAINMPKVSNKSFIFASTYGTRGLKGLRKMGENKFMKRVGFNSNLAKTTYKGNLNSLFNYLLKHIPNYALFGMVFLGLGYFVLKFFKVVKRFT
jgi:hypothetical protein